MTPRLRRLLFAAAIFAIAPLAVLVLRRLPPFGHYPGPYGDAVNALVPGARQVTNMVTAINFDVRALDTIGEEFILLAAVTGATVLLRGGRGEGTGARSARLPGRPLAPPSEAVILAARWFSALLLLFGIYVVLHAAITPGGGFQGGAIIGSASLLLYLGEGYRSWRRLIGAEPLERLEGVGCALFVLAGFAGLFAAGTFLANALPLAPAVSILSGGLIPVVNLGVACAVACGFTLLFLEFLEETREPKQGGK
jgi:multicomponent Na+:H+ antiporter subunit B